MNKDRVPWVPIICLGLLLMGAVSALTEGGDVGLVLLLTVAFGVAGGAILYATRL